MFLKQPPKIRNYQSDKAAFLIFFKTANSHLYSALKVTGLFLNLWSDHNRKYSLWYTDC